MIVGTLQDSKTVELLSKCAGFEKAFCWLKENAGSYPDGITELDGSGLYVNVHGYDTRPQSECTWESHRHTIDLQLIISGSERIDWATSDKDIISSKYDEMRDFETWQDGIEVDSTITMRAGMFVVFFAGELHCPMISVDGSESIRKLVVKIDADMV